MSQSFETQGSIHSIGETKEFGQNGFTKREFVILLTGADENPRYPNYVALELTKDKCALMDSYSVGDEIKVTFNLSGRLWAGNGQGEKCFTSLQCWRIDAVGANMAEAAYDQSPAYAPAPAQSTASSPTGNSAFANDDFGDIPF